LSQANVDTVKELYAAFGREDLETVREMMAPDIEWYEAESFPYEDGNPYVGPDAVLDGVYARLTGEWDGFTEELGNVLDAGEQVVTTGYYTGTYKPTGKHVRAQFVHVWTARNGRITAFQQYTDTAQFRDATKPGQPG
jgi:ketosteroid isomerase-like protein